LTFSRDKDKNVLISYVPQRWHAPLQGRPSVIVPPAAILLLAVALLGSAAALAAFVWAVRKGQLDPTNTGSKVVFADEGEPKETE
jgi:cbb3-type cytochrome oxidase maturation protein